MKMYASFLLSHANFPCFLVISISDDMNIFVNPERFASSRFYCICASSAMGQEGKRRKGKLPADTKVVSCGPLQT